MKIKILNIGLYQPITIKLKNNKTLNGYLIKDENNKKRYKILPLNINDEIYVFYATHVKNYKLLYNGCIIK